MREKPREKESDNVQTRSINSRIQAEKTSEASKEDEDILRCNIKEMSKDNPMVDAQTEEGKSEKEGNEQIEPQGSKVGGDKGTTPLTGGKKGISRTQISYKSKLVGREGDTPTAKQDFDALMNEWLREEKETAPELSDEQKLLLQTLPHLHMPDERLKELCRSWKDALILTLLGRNVNLGMMKDRVGWMLKAENFELINLLNNYFVFRSEDTSLAQRLRLDGPWVIEEHYLVVLSFNPYCFTVKKVAIWVRAPTLPVHCYSEDFLMELGNLIGRALKVDMITPI